MNLKRSFTAILALSVVSGTSCNLSYADNEMNEELVSKISNILSNDNKFKDNSYMEEIFKSMQVIGEKYEEAQGDDEKRKILSDNIIKTEAEIDSCKNLVSSNSTNVVEKKELEKKILALQYKRDFLVKLKGKTGSLLKEFIIDTCKFPFKIIKKVINIIIATCKLPFKLAKFSFKIIAIIILIIVSPIVFLTYPIFFVVGLLLFCLYA